MKYIIYFIISYFICFIIHEAGHIYGIMYNGGTIKEVSLPFIILVKIDNKWTIRFWKNFSKGNVLLDINSLKCIEDCTRLKKILLNELILGPVFSIIYELELSIFWVISMYKFSGYNSIMIVVQLNLLINLMLIINSFRNVGNIICDFQAFKYIKNSKIFYYGYILEYLMLSTNNIIKIKESTSFINYLLDLLMKQNNIFENEDSMYILYDYLTLYIAGYVEEDSKVEIIVNNIINNIDNYFDKEKLIDIILLIRVIQYLVINKKNNIAKGIYKDYFDNNFYSDKEIILFLIKELKFLLDIDNDGEWLLSKVNIKNSLVNKEYFYLIETQKVYKDIYNKIVSIKGAKCGECFKS